jgi:hypothetical protein
MERNRLILLVFFLFVHQGLALCQTLLFTNQLTQQQIRVVPGHMISVSYMGYNGVPEFAKLTITDINDSCILLGVDPSRIAFLRGNTDGPILNTYKVIKIRDIVAFRRISVGRRILKSSLRIAAYVGTFLLVTELIKSASVSTLETYFISLGTGLGSVAAIDFLLPDKTKHRINNGWTWRVVQE